MGKEANEAKKFSESVERLLAGQEIGNGEDVSEDYKTALKFAQKLTDYRAAPSPLFKARLKERLLLKLTEQEAEASRQKEKSSWFWEGLRNLLPQTVALRAAAAVLVVIIVSAGVLWRAGIFTQPSEPMGAGGLVTAPPTSPRLPAAAPESALGIFIEVEATTNKNTYLLGEDIVIEFSFKNVTPEPFQIDAFPPAIEIMRPSPYDETVRSFPGGTAIKSLAPGEAINYTITWHQRDDHGQQVPYGYYSLKLGSIRLGDGTTTLNLSESRQLLILPPEGVIEKTIKVNQSQVANGITITLERVELSAMEAKFYAFNAPPDYNLPQSLKPPPPQLMIHASAEYSLDSGPMKKAGFSGIRFLENGIAHTWDNLDPIPKGTKELIFIITELGDWQGHWEFTIPLQS